MSIGFSILFQAIKNNLNGFWAYFHIIQLLKIKIKIQAMRLKLSVLLQELSED